MAKISDFFKKEYTNWANYDNYRSLPSICDGQKVSARKVLYTMMEQNIKDLKKVQQLKARVSEFTNYLHGDDALIGVIVGLAQEWVGTNNIPLIKGDGNFGSRLKPAAAADRYIFVATSKILNKTFRSEDAPVLIQQTFEGEKIEPKYFIPVLPILLINGSTDALSVGFASNILPRKPDEVAQAIYDILDGKEPARLDPWWRGFKGIVARNEEGGLETRGLFKKISPKEVFITDLPLGPTLAKYRETLDDLENKKIIQSWRDESDPKTDTFKFKVKLAKVIPDQEIYPTLKLIKKFSENFTVIDENNQVRVFENEIEILKHYVNLRLEYYKKRKAHIISVIEKDLTILRNRLNFLKAVISGDLVVFKRKKADVAKDLEDKKFDKVDDSYDYLLKTPVENFTKDKTEELVNKFKKRKEDLEEIKAKDIKIWWKEEIKELLDAIEE